MASSGSFGPGPFITPGRKTTVSLDEPDWTLQQEAFDREYFIDQIGPNDSTLLSNMQFHPNKGWTIASYQSQLQEFHELGQGTSILATDFTLAGDGINSGWNPKNIQRYNADLPGVPQGALTAYGDPFVWKFVGASQSWNQALSADQTSFPGPNPSGDNVPLDRIAVSKAGMYPGTDICIRWFFGGSTSQAQQRINTFYFTSLAGYASTDPVPGSGAYSITFQADGFAVLNELLSDQMTWVQRTTIPWEVPGRVIGAYNGHICKISSDVQLLSSGLYSGSRLFFQFTDSSANSTLSQSQENYVVAQQIQTYQIPSQTGVPIQPMQAFPIRIDWRRDTLGGFQVSYIQFLPSGTLTMRSFPYAVTYSPGTELRIEFFGYFPPDTNLTIAMVDQDGHSVPLSGNSSFNLTSGYVGFLPWGVDPDPIGPNYTPTFFFTTSNAFATPLLNRVRLASDAKLREYSPVPVVLESPTKVTHLSWSGPTDDLTQESILVRCVDMTGALDILRVRASMIMQVKTQTGMLDPNTGQPLESVLSRSYVNLAARTQLGNYTGKDYPAPDWGRYDIHGTGMWQRLWEMTMPTTRDFSYDPNRVDPNTGVTLPYKVTDVIRALLLYRFPKNMVIIPDYSLPFLGNQNNGGKGPSLLVEFMDQIGPYVVDLAKLMFGGWLIFDTNATSINGAPPPPDSTDPFGAWRMITPPVPPYNNLWAFWTTPQTKTLGGTYPLVAPLSPAAYPDTHGKSQEGIGVQIVKNTWIRRLFRNDVQPPEFNMIWVSGQGIGQIGSLAIGDDKIQLTSRAFNPSSAYFFDDQPVPPDPSSPDYLGRVVQVYKGDPGDVSQAACDFDARRTIQIAGHGRKRAVIEAPLMFNVDIFDPYQIRPRIPRKGDPALINGQQFYINSVNPSYSFEEGGDRAQMCVYELYSINFPTDFQPLLPDDPYD